MKTSQTATRKRPTGDTRARKSKHRAEPPKQVALPSQRARAKAKELSPPSPPPSTPTVRTSKKRMIEALLRRPEGVGMAGLIAATGWQAHSVRAALTGFRKAGCTIEREQDASETRYRIVEAR